MVQVAFYISQYTAKGGQIPANRSGTKQTELASQRPQGRFGWALPTELVGILKEERRDQT